MFGHGKLFNSCEFDGVVELELLELGVRERQKYVKSFAKTEDASKKIMVDTEITINKDNSGSSWKKLAR